MSEQIITARQLIDGSANINLMKTQIHFVVKTIFSMILQANDLKGKAESFEIEDYPGGVMWEIRVVVGDLMAECRMPPGWNQVGYSNYVDPAQFGPINTVSFVHDSLDAFIKGMTEHFPNSGWRLATKPYIVAAQKKF